MGQLTLCIVATEDATDETDEVTELEALFAADFAIELAAEDDFLALLTIDSKKEAVGLSMTFIMQIQSLAMFILV